MLLATLIQIVNLLTNVLVMLILVQFVLGMLIAFNVVKRGNDFVFAMYQSINTLLDPVLRPIRRIMPATGAMDFSPLVLIVLLQVLTIVLSNLAALA